MSRRTGAAAPQCPSSIRRLPYVPSPVACEIVPFQSAIGLSITARCPIECAHCIVEAGRHRTEEMDAGAARVLLDACAGYGGGRMEAVIITGGEPFFAPALLRSILAHAPSVGLVPTVVTNAFWATTERAAVATLKALPEIGMLTLSTDRFHQKYISLDKFRNAVSAARQLSIPFNVAVCADSEADLEVARGQLKGLVESEQIRLVINLPAGRRAAPPRSSVLPEPDRAGGPCTGADFPVVFPDGRVIACMGVVNGLPLGHPLLLGNVNQTPLQDLLRAAEDNVFVHAMRALGPTGILGGLRGKPAARLPPGYEAHGRCALCYAMAGRPDLLDKIRRCLAQDELLERTAYARLYFLGEEEMARRLSGARWAGAAEGRDGE